MKERWQEKRKHNQDTLCVQHQGFTLVLMGNKEQWLDPEGFDGASGAANNSQESILHIALVVIVRICPVSALIIKVTLTVWMPVARVCFPRGKQKKQTKNSKGHRSRLFAWGILEYKFGIFYNTFLKNRCDSGCLNICWHFHIKLFFIFINL